MTENNNIQKTMPPAKAAFDDLIRLKLRREERQEQPTDIFVKSLGKTMQFIAPTHDQQLDFIAAVRRAGNINGSYDAYRCLVYDCCPMLHDDKLHAELGVVEPYDIIDKLFGPIEVMEIGDTIADMYMASLADDVKNSSSATTK